MELCTSRIDELTIFVGCCLVQLQPTENFSDKLQFIGVDEWKRTHNSSFFKKGILWDESISRGFREELARPVGDSSHTLE